ncbi:MAG TPA: hypothetical protein VK001_10710 [Geminicoccaceae bacterium]|nr:hypothetical protein [Geminicoccaceae bacterium]
MIASFTHDFIFIKTRKTAGTSVEIVLSAWCSGRDICTPISADDEILRRRYGGAPRNFHRNAAAEAIYRWAVETQNAKIIAWTYERIRKGLAFHNHMPAAAVRAALPDLWRRAYKFTIDRHPYETVVSLAWFWIGRYFNGDASRLPEAIERAIEQARYDNSALYAEDRALLVDEVIPYESLWPRMEEIASRFGQSLPAALPLAKARSRLDRTPAREVLTAGQKARIAERCALAFDLFGYRP